MKPKQSTLTLTPDRAAQVQKQERHLTDLEHQLAEANAKVKEIKAQVSGAQAELRRLIAGDDAPLPFEKPKPDPDFQRED